jgi:hypothetical protein
MSLAVHQARRCLSAPEDHVMSEPHVGDPAHVGHRPGQIVRIGRLEGRER